MRLTAHVIVAASVVLMLGATSAYAAEAPETIGGDQLAGTGDVAVSPNAPNLPAVESASWLVADLDSGEVLAAHSAHLPLPPASTLKLLTAITLLPDVAADLAYDATDADASVEGSRVGLVPEETYTKSDLEHGLMLASGNDAAHALAEISGGQDAAIAAMNDEAARLGAFNTVAATPHGLDDPGQVSTAYDLALIARAALADEALAGLMATRTYDFPSLDDETFQIQNQNRLLGRYDGTIGLKTGFTTEAGHTLAAAAAREDVRLVVTVFNPEDGRAEPVAEELLDWGFAAAGAADPVGTLVTPEEIAEMVAGQAVALDETDGADDRPDDTAEAVGRLGRGLDLPSWGAPATIAAIALLLALIVIRRRRRGPSGKYAT